jgi:hypothetical protein
MIPQTAAAGLAALTLKFNPPMPEYLTEEPEDDILSICKKIVGINVTWPQMLSCVLILFFFFLFRCQILGSCF